eukprot:10118.XXX_122514_124844_1 [CDS] Oithona nana genome sequencing.
MVMAPTDRSHIGTDLNSDTSRDFQPSFHRRPRLSKLSLGRPRKTSYEEILPAKKIRLDSQEIEMNGQHNSHHGGRVLDSGRFSSNSNSTAPSKSISSSVASSQASVASLCNLGNTCFLNSVLYTLRFTPGFLHNLHHLTADLGIGIVQTSSTKDKRGRGNGHISNGHSNLDAETERIHDVIEQLHDLFRNMSQCDDYVAEREANSSSSSSREPIAPSSFLNAVGKMNALFEGNQQQDAHELLIALLTTLRDIKIPTTPSTTTKLSTAYNHDDIDHHSDISNKKEKEKKGKGKKSFLISNGNHNSSSSTSVKLVSSTPKVVESNGVSTTMPPESVTTNGAGTDDSMPNFVRDNFVGKTVFRTKCLECETSTYRSDKFINIDIPLTFDDELSLETMSNGFISAEADSSIGTSSSSNGGSSSRHNPATSNTLSVADLFLKQIMASETLRENNKYLCAECSRLNEAQRSVQYELLPKVLVLQLKRFTAATNKSAYMSKINDFIPTPFTMNCFCVQCLPPDAPLLGPPPPPGGILPPKHHYRLFSVIMHLGATLASGHYIAYVRASVDLNLDYSRCPRASQVASTVNGSNGQQDSRRGNSSGGSSHSYGGNGKKGIMKYFSRSNEKNNGGNSNSASSSSSSTTSSSSTSNNSSAPHNTNGSCENGHQMTSMNCRSANCCGMQRILHQLNNRSSSELMPNGASAGGNRYRQRSQESLDSNSVNGGGSIEVDSSSSSASSHMEDLWLECDDENISIITRRQFEEELNSKQSATTPYLLFYERI